MVEIRRNSSETVQAQIAAFTSERILDHRVRDRVFDNIAKLAVNEPEDMTRLAVYDEAHRSPTGETIVVPKGTEVTMARAGDYTNFLRSVGGSRYEDIQGRSDLLSAFTAFVPTIKRLREELADPVGREKHPAFLGAGANSMAFTIEQEGKRYAVRVPRGSGLSPSTIDSYLAGAVLGRGVPHLEQVIAASYEDGVTVAEIVPGKGLGALTAKEAHLVTDSQLTDLVDTVIVANKKGIEIDPKPSNLLYDTETGFAVIDYSSSKVARLRPEEQRLDFILGEIAHAIGGIGSRDKLTRMRMTVDDYSHDLEISKLNLELIERYKAVIESKLQGETRQKALDTIDESLKHIKRTVANYSDPDWVDAQIAQADERRRLSRETETVESDIID